MPTLKGILFCFFMVIREEVFQILENQSHSQEGKWVEKFLFFTIIASVILAVFETIPTFSEYHLFFLWGEGLCTLIFTVEYIARLWSVPFHEKYKGKWGRLRYALTPLMILDLIVILPFFLHIFLPVEFVTAGLLRFFRLIRIFRIMRLGEYSISLNRMTSLILRHKEDLAAIYFLSFCFMAILSTIMYFLEHNDPKTEFTSIPTSMWWGIVTLATVGYGDMVPQTELGRLIGAIGSVFGVAIFALPTAVLGAAFYADLRSKEQRRITELEKEVHELEKILEENGIDKNSQPLERKTLFDWLFS